MGPDLASTTSQSKGTRTRYYFRLDMIEEERSSVTVRKLPRRPLQTTLSSRHN